MRTFTSSSVLIFITISSLVYTSTSDSGDVDNWPSFDPWETGSDDCQSCLDDIPDMLLSMPPPPPIPSFMQGLLNESLIASLLNVDASIEGCNLCSILAPDVPFTMDGTLGGFRNVGVGDGPFMPVLPKPSDKNMVDEAPPPPSSSSPPSTDSMISVIAASVLGLSFGFLLIVLVYCRKTSRSLPPGMQMDSLCPIFSNGFFGGHSKSSHHGGSGVQASPSESEFISPVVNEKSPQSSIIVDHHMMSGGVKKVTVTQHGPTSVIQSKYWRRGTDFTTDVGGSNSSSSHQALHHQNDNYTDGSTCTSSPVYAELDAAVGGTSISPYAVGLNTYSELPIPRGGQMMSAGPSDSSYDNAAYLTSQAAADHYNRARSLRRGMNIVGSSGQLASAAAPLLSSSGQQSFLTTGRQGSGKKAVSGRGQVNFLHQLAARNSIQRMSQEMESLGIIDTTALPGTSGQARYTSRRTLSSHQQLLMDQLNSSPQAASMTTFKSASPYGTYIDRRDSRSSSSGDKRPLPPVPGVRL